MEQNPKALENVGPNALAALNEDDYGYGDEISSEGLQIPLIKLCQNATRERPAGVNPGDWYNASTGKNYGTDLIIHVFKSHRGRVKFTQEYKLECKSDDCISGSTYGQCVQCEFSKWVDDRDERKKKYCSPVVTFLCVADGDVFPGMLGMSKGREKVANKVNSQLKFLVMENKIKPQDKRIPICFYKIKLSSVMEELNGEKIYSVKNELVGYEQDETRQAVLIGLFREWKSFANDVSKVSGEAASDPQAEGPKESKAF